MAIFSNQATLSYNGNNTNSNIVFGELLEILTATKTAVEGAYLPGELVTYVVALRNTGTTALTGLTLSDDLGGFPFGTGILYPLTYEADSLLVYVNGVLQPTPAVTAGPPLGITGITVPTGGDAVIVYQARANSFASPEAGGNIDNTVTITGGGLVTPVTATETISAEAAPALTITKSISPTQVVDNQRITYTFVIQNTGNTPVVATDNAIITDTFDPILSDLVVTFNGIPWTQGVQYNYTPATGLFATLPGQITVPAATYTQDPVTGEFTVTPGTATLTVSGTV